MVKKGRGGRLAELPPVRWLRHQWQARVLRQKPKLLPGKAAAKPTSARAAAGQAAQLRAQQASGVGGLCVTPVHYREGK